jgi:DNA repair exonuclease SbcCD ATPase subunit
MKKGDMQKISKYDSIVISDKAKEGMSLTSDDIQWLKRAFDRQDLDLQDYIAETYKINRLLILQEVKSMLADQRTYFDESLKEIRESINEIKSDISFIKKDLGGVKSDVADIWKKLDEHEDRLKKLEAK